MARISQRRVWRFPGKDCLKSQKSFAENGRAGTKQVQIHRPDADIFCEISVSPPFISPRDLSAKRTDGDLSCFDADSSLPLHTGLNCKPLNSAQLGGQMCNN